MSTQSARCCWAFPEACDPEEFLGPSGPKLETELKMTLKALTSLNQEVRPFFLSDNSIWSLPSFLPLAITAFGDPEGYFNLAIIAFGAFQFIVSRYYYCLGKMEFKESRLHNLRRLRSQGGSRSLPAPWSQRFKKQSRKRFTN